MYCFNQVGVTHFPPVTAVISLFHSHSCHVFSYYSASMQKCYLSSSHKVANIRLLKALVAVLDKSYQCIRHLKCRIHWRCLKVCPLSHHTGTTIWCLFSRTLHTPALVSTGGLFLPASDSAYADKSKTRGGVWCRKWRDWKVESANIGEKESALVDTPNKKKCDSANKLWA